MSSNPTSFRFPFQLTGKIDAEAEQAIRYAFQGLKDANDAFAALTPMVNSNTAAISALRTSVVTQGSTTSGSTVTVNIGSVNDQSGNIAYSLQGSDFGAMVVVDTASPFALALNNAVNSPFFAVISNLGAGLITATPISGTVNGAATWSIPGNQSALVFYDGRNWWSTPMPPFAQTFTPITHEWLDGYDSTTGLFAASQPAAQDLTNGVTGLGRVVLDSGATITGAHLVAPVVTGILSIFGLPSYANNAAAIAGGLVVGNVFKTGGDPDIIAVVH